MSDTFSTVEVNMWAELEQSYKYFPVVGITHKNSKY